MGTLGLPALDGLEAHIPMKPSASRKPNQISEGQTELLVIPSLPHKSVMNLQFCLLWDGLPGPR